MSSEIWAKLGFNPHKHTRTSTHTHKHTTHNKARDNNLRSDDGGLSRMRHNFKV